MLNKLDITKIIEKEGLPRSSHSTLYLYPGQESNEPEFIVKKVQAKDFAEFQQALQPVILGFKLNNPFVVPVIDYNAQQNEEAGYNVYIQMPKMQGNLLVLLEQVKATGIKISKIELTQHFYTLVSGLDYLHDQKIAHGNIKPTNILIDNEGRLTLSDIGTFPEGESALYLAPEMEKDLQKADIWSLGLVIVLLFLQKANLIQELYASQNKEDFVGTLVDEITEEIGEEVAGIVKQMLVLEPEKRIVAKEAKKLLDIQLGNVPVREIT